MFLTHFFLALGFIFSISLYVAKSTFKSQSLENSLLGSRSIPLPALTLTFVATQLGGSAIIASATSALEYGHQALLYTTGLSLGFLIHALGFGQKMRKTQVSTIAQLFEKFYSSKQLRLISSIIVMTSLFLILTSISVSSWSFMQSLGIENRLSFFLVWAIMIAYTSAGGLNAVIKTDMIQVCFVLATLSILSIYFGFEPTYLAFNINLENLNTNALESSKVVTWIVMPTLFTLIGQDMGQRCFAANKPSTVTKATLLASFIMFLAGTVPVGLALLVKNLNSEAQSFIDIILFIESKSPFIAALFSAATATAIISTADSLLCAIGSSLAFDILSTYFQSLNQKQLKTASSAGIFILGFSAVCFSIYFTDMMTLVIQSYTISVVLLSSSIIFAILFGPFPSIISKLSMILALSSYALGYYFHIGFHDIIALIFSTFSFIVHMIFKKKE